jgi:putative nucleotidyltransferase with HDIG domain
VAYHGPRLAVVLVLALTVHALFPISPVPDIPVLEKGMVADRDVIARIGFPIYKSGNDLARERTEAGASVPPIFVYDASAADSLVARSRAFFGAAAAAAAVGGGQPAQLRALAAVTQQSGLAVSPELLRPLLHPGTRAALARSLELAAREELSGDVATTADLRASAAPQLRIRRDGREQLVAREAVHRPTWLYDRASLRLPPSTPPGAEELQRLLLIRFAPPTIRLDRVATAAAQALAREAVSPVAGQVLPGERVVGAHEQIGEEELQRFHSYRDELTRQGRLEGGRTGRMRTLGAFLFDLIVLLVFASLVRIYRPSVYRDFRHVLVVASLVVGLVAVAAIIDRVLAPVELIPIAVPALVVAALWDGRMALNLALVLAVLLAGQAPFLGISVLFTMVTGGSAAALCVRVVRRRAQIWVFMALIAAAYAAAAITLGLLRSRPGVDILGSITWGIINAMGSSLVAMGLMPLLESVSRITTDQTLLELADMNRPLLRRLALEAPGTYAHSVSVANLAEAAARAAGANPLLARVGTYYHDVGKIGKPQYYVENQGPGRNPHERLKPGTSAAIVRSHVTEGMRLAEQYRLPESIRAFIREHHGTQPIGFFLDQAREQNPGAELNPAEYSYPGPRPQSKETAILMLSDAVESAARVLQDPTPERVHALVDRIVDGKVAQGQLDESPLTLGEISRIKIELEKVLTGMYHHRIDYPARDANGNGGSALAAAPPPESGKAAP